MADSSNGGRSVGFVGMLTILFIGLKLAEIGVVANWSWIWVLSPLWISAGLGVLFFMSIMALAIIGSAITK